MADLETSLARVLESRLRNLHTAFPGKVQSYDAQQQEADIIPLLNRTIPGREDDDPDAVEELPVLMHVPVLFPRVGAFGITLPLAEGDTVLVVCCERDIGRWRATGERDKPDVARLHPLSGAVAIPGLYPTAQAIEGGADGTNMVLGHLGDGPKVTITPTRVEVAGSSDAAAKASAVEDELAGIKAALDTIASAVPTTHEYVPGNVGSEKLKLGG